MVAGALALEVAYGAPLGDAVLYVGYELGFLIVPGWLAYRALSHRPGGALRQLAIGWALGYVLEILAFMLTAATGTRALFAAYPLIVGAAALAQITRRRPAAEPMDADPHLSRRFGWLLVAVCLVAMAYIAVAYFPNTPLPGARNVHYFQDYPWELSLAADAKHHWPIEDPNVSGQPEPYHYFVYIHLAAASQVTGLNLPLVFFRLFICPMVALLVLELVVAGQSFARNAYAGLIAACLTLFIGEMQLDARQSALVHIPFIGALFTLMYVSPSFLFGLVLFVPLITMLGERITPEGETGRIGDWLLLALFAIGASDAKIVLLPLVLGALLLYAGWRWLVERRVPLAVWLAAALSLVVLGAVYVLQYRGHSSNLSVDLTSGIDFFTHMPAVSLVKNDLMSALPAFPGKGVVLSTGGIIFGFLGLLAAQLVGLVWIFRDRGHRLRANQTWLLSLFGAGLFVLVAISAPGTGNELYFFFYGLVAGCILSAEGLWIAWERRPPLSGRTRRLAAVGFAWVVILAGLMAAPKLLGLFSGSAGIRPFEQVPGVGSPSEAHTYMFWYGGLVLALAGLYVIARRWFGPTRWAAAALVCGGILSVGALDAPIDQVEPGLTHPPGTTTEGQRVTPELYAALRWIRDNTPSGSVIAVNNPAPLEFDYAAFAERRVFFEGWAYSQRSRDAGYGEGVVVGFAQGLANPFPGRDRLNKAAFTGNRRALQTMVERYGVRYLVVDGVNGPPTDVRALTRSSRIVYQAPGVMVLEVS